MAQFLNHPPTLARWTYGVRNRLAGLARWIVFLFPAAVLSMVVLIPVIRKDEAPPYVRSAEILLLIVVVALPMISVWYSRTCNFIWRRTFAVINPGLQLIKDRPWRIWMKVTEEGSRDRRRFLRSLTAELRSTEPEMTPGTVTVQASLTVEHLPSSYGKQREMAEKLYTRARKEAGRSGLAVGEFTRVTTLNNTIAGSKWTVEVECRFKYRPGPTLKPGPEPSPQPPSPPAVEQQSQSARPPAPPLLHPKS